MTQVTVRVGGRDFDVACREGEESYLKAAAALLDAEAATLLEHMGRMPEATMLLMSGLMLADKTAANEERLRRAEEKVAAREARIAELENRPEPKPQRIEVPYVPPEVTQAMASVAARAKAIADEVEAGAR